MKGLEWVGLLGLWHWFHLLRTLTHDFALCICWVYKSRNDNLVPREHACCHPCSPSIKGDYDLLWVKPGLAKRPASRVQMKLAPAEVSFWETFLMLSESRPIRKVIWQKKSPKPLKVLYIDVHEILPSISKYIKTQISCDAWTISKCRASWVVTEWLGLPSSGDFTSSFSCEWHLKYFSFEAHVKSGESLRTRRDLLAKGLSASDHLPTWMQKSLNTLCCCILVTERESPTSEAFPLHICLPPYFITYKHRKCESYTSIYQAAFVQSTMVTLMSMYKVRLISVLWMHTYISQTCKNVNMP